MRRPVIPTVLWGRVRVPSGPQKLQSNLELFAFMSHYVYILESLKDGTFYKGYTSEPLLRLQQHNNKASQYTSTKTPWKLVYVEELPSKRDALIREKNMKKASMDRLLALINHPKNIVSKFVER